MLSGRGLIRECGSGRARERMPDPCATTPCEPLVDDDGGRPVGRATQSNE
jgi:hypothetical protein